MIMGKIIILFSSFVTYEIYAIIFSVLTVSKGFSLALLSKTLNFILQGMGESLSKRTAWLNLNNPNRPSGTCIECLSGKNGAST